MTIDEQYMHRCLELARLGAGNVAPNPMVGAVLVCDGIIIGEGYHQQYGQAHAEVNCIGQAIQEGKQSMFSQSVLYVSLEPCAHFGKTPPCADLIIRHKIPKVVIGCRDPFKEVDGKGIEKLKSAGIEVVIGVLEKECKDLNKRFFTFYTRHRPYIILKWAETKDGFIAHLPASMASPNPSEEKVPLPPKGEASPNPSKGGALGSLNDKKFSALADSENPPLGGRGASPRLFITNQYTNRLVHKWRSEEAGILVGTNTAFNDDPELTTRLWPGHSPVRLIVDMHLRLPAFLKLFDKKVKTIVFNSIKHEEEDNLLYYQVTEDVSIVHQILHALYQLKIQSIIVEGGAKLLQSFIDEEAWDEARVIGSEQLAIGNGLKAPVLANAVKADEQAIFSDRIIIYYNQLFS